MWKWVQKFNPKRVYCCKRRVPAFLIDETMLQTGSNEAWMVMDCSQSSQSVDKSVGFTFQGTEI